MILGQRAALECRREFRVSEEWLAAILVCRTTHGTRCVPQDTFLKIHLLQQGHLHHSSRSRVFWHHLLANWDQVTPILPWDMEKDWDENRRVQQYRLLVMQKVPGPLYRAGGTYSQNCMMETPRYTIHFQFWRVSFKTERRKYMWVHLSLNSQCHGSTKWRWQNQWTICRRLADGPNQWMIWWRRSQFKCMNSLILKCLVQGLRLRRERSSSIPLPEGESVLKSSEHKKNKIDSWETRQIAHMIYEHFPATGAYDAAQGFLDLFNICLKNDDVQDFDTRWDQILLGTSEYLTSMSRKVRTKPSCRVPINWLCSIKNWIDIKQRRATKIENDGKTTDWSDDWHAQLQCPQDFFVDGSIGQESQREKIQRWKESGRMFFRGKRLDSVREETLVVSLTRKPRETNASTDPDPIPVKEHNHLLLLGKRRPGLTEGSFFINCFLRGEGPSGLKGRRQCKDFLRDYDTLPVCIIYKSESGCKCGDSCLFRHTEADGQPSNKSKKGGGKDHWPYWKRILNLVVRPMIAFRKSLFCGKNRLGSIYTVTPSSSPRPRCVTQKFGEKRVLRRQSFKNATLTSEFWEVQNSRKERRTKPSGKSGAPAEQPGTWRRMSIGSEGVTRYVKLSCRSLGDADTLFDKSRRATIRDRLWSFCAHVK